MSEIYEPALVGAKLYIGNASPEYLAVNRRWQGIPAIERTASGRIFVCWYSGGETEGPGNVIIVEKSDDDGKTWTDGFMVVSHDDPIVRCFDPALWINPLGELCLFWTQSKSYYDGRDGVWMAVCKNPDADAIIFDEPRRIANGLMLNKPTVLSNGEWLFPAALWTEEFNVPGEFHPELCNELSANVYVSADEGKTFAFRGGVSVPQRAFDEHMLVELRDGRVWMLVRTKYGIGQAFSRDRGRTWENAGPSGHSGPNSRFYIRRLKSGKLLLVNHVNPSNVTSPASWNTRNNLMAMLSDDDGKTWRGGLMIDTRDRVSYPDAVETDDGRIYLIYDYDRYGESEILMTVFTEEDILEGAYVSDKAVRRVVVSKVKGNLIDR